METTVRQETGEWFEGCGAWVRHCPRHVHVAFPEPRPVLSSAVYNGGFVQAVHLLNLKVSDSDPGVEPPEVTLARYCRQASWQGTAVGMMTGASMDSLRRSGDAVSGVSLCVLATAGLSHPRCAGDPADYREPVPPEPAPGTINVVVVTDARLSPAAMVEAVMIAAEAKSAAMLRLGIRSAVSGETATGTGTDAVAVACGCSGPEIRYCGKHVRFGERLGRAVIRAVSDSVTQAR